MRHRCLYYYFVHVQGEKGDIVRNVATSHLLDHLAEKLGTHCHETDVGFKNITRTMEETDSLLGGESSGGLTKRGYLHGKDSTFALMLFFNMVDAMGKTVSQIVEEMKSFACFHEIYQETFVRYPLEKEPQIFHYLCEKSPAFPKPILKKEVLGRNVRYTFSTKEWALLRLSGTENALRIVVELDPTEKLSSYEQSISDFIVRMP